MRELWVVVVGWSKFQHYGARRDPPWIKQYNELVHRDEYLSLSLAERGLLHGIWSLYALSGGQLRAETVGQLLRCKPRDVQWQSLIHAGFIHLVASKPLALRALAREEKSREEKTERSRAQKPTPEPTAARTNASAYEFGGANQIHDQVRVDEAMLELARGWLDTHR